MKIKKSIFIPIKASVLIPDGESALLFTVVNCLSQIPGVTIFVMSSLKLNAFRFSTHVSKFKYYPETENDQEWIQNINAVIKKYEIDIVMPIYEIGIRRMIKNKQYLDRSTRLVPLPNLDTFTIAIDKWKLVTYCNNHKIPVPQSFLYLPHEEFTDTFLSEIKFPVIAKPLKGFGGGMGIHFFKTKKDLVESLNKKTKQSLIIQKFIKGHDIDCSILAEEGRILAYTIQKGNMQDVSPYMPYLGIEFTDCPEVLKVVEKLISFLKWDGLANIDLRYDEENDIYKVIEVNPRYWATLDASSLMGVNFPYLQILQTLGKKFSKPDFKNESYLNLKGFVKTIRKDFFFLKKRKFIMNNTQFRFVIYDVAPVIYKYFDRTKNIIFRNIKRYIIPIICFWLY